MTIISDIQHLLPFRLKERFDATHARFPVSDREILESNSLFFDFITDTSERTINSRIIGTPRTIVQKLSCQYMAWAQIAVARTFSSDTARRTVLAIYFLYSSSIKPLFSNSRRCE